MCKLATKAYNNVYYQARLKASKTNKKYTSRIGAAEDLNINQTTLAKYELEMIPIPPDTVITMSQIYDAPELINQYCSQHCIIGKTYKSEIEIKDLALISLQIISRLEDINVMKRNLIDVVADGIIDESEERTIEDIVDYFGKMKQTISELELWLQKNNIEKKIKKEPK